MYLINKYWNYGKITPLPSGILANQLDKELQYTRQGAQFMPHPEWAIVRLYGKAKGTFPWGLLDKVEHILKTFKQEYTIVYKQSLQEMKPLPIILRPYQVDAVKELIRGNNGILCMPTGAGKTLVVCEYLKLYPNLRSVVVVPTIDIRTQWQSYNVPNMLVTTYQNPELKKEKFMEQFDIHVYDECHHVAAKSLYTLAMKCKTSAKLIGVSATTTREDREDMRIFGALGPVIYTIPRDELIRLGFLANAKVFYLQPRFPNDGKYMTYQEVYVTDIVENDDRNDMIISTALEEAKNQRKILILVSQITHGEYLYNQLKDGKYKVAFMNGKVKDRGRDMNQYNIIIATSIYDEGYDLPTLDTIILAAGGKSSIKLTQRIGRVLRPKHDGREAHIYDFEDTPKYLRKHYMKRMGILAEDFEIINGDI